jgi:hypothetical protein
MGGVMYKANMLIIFLLITYSGSAVAIGASAPVQPAWWISLLLSAALLVVSGYVKGVKDDTMKLREDLQDLRDSVLRDYHPKTEVKEQYIELKAMIRDLQRSVERRE